MNAWRNWSGLESSEPRRVAVPASTEQVAAEVRTARAAGETVKMVGSGHSFTGIGRPGDVMLDPTGLRGLVHVDPERHEVTVRAGTRLRELNRSLTQLGLGLHNMGDVDPQTVSGAVSTGTHGTGGQVAGIAAQLAGFTLVTGTGEVLRASREENPELFNLGRVGLGALGILTELTFAVEPAYAMQAQDAAMSWDETLQRHDELVEEHHHFEFYWFPHTDATLTKRNDRLADSETEPIGRLAAWREDELMSNGVFALVNRLGNAVPAAIPTINRIASRALSDRTYSDIAPKVYVSPRRVRFREMEYALPYEAGLEALREARRRIERDGFRIGFPVEVRNARADDVPLSTAYRRDTVYLAFHVNSRTDHTAYFAAMEEIMVAHGGRPHWGKLHSRSAEHLTGLYPRFEDFRTLRGQLDPDRVFDNDYLRRVLDPV